MVAFQFLTPGHPPGPVIFDRWWGPTGSNEKGRFVKRGSPEECSQLSFLKLRARNIKEQRYVRILGKIVDTTLY